MPKTRPPYPPQLRARLIELARSGRSPEELGRQFEPSAQTIRNWLKQADRDDGRRADGLTIEEREEVRRLRREVNALREEPAILRNAAAWFAREADSLPSRDTTRWRKLLRDPRVRTPRPPPVRDPGRGPARRLRLPRRVVEPVPSPLGPGLRVAHAL
jgi:transposase